jgi:hypothetical protein
MGEDRMSNRFVFEPLERRQLFCGAGELLDDIDASQPAPMTAQSAAPLSLSASAPVQSESGIKFPASFSAISDAPTARFDLYNFVIGGKLWLVGGFGAGFKVVPGAEIFDPDTNQWTTRPDIHLKAAETHAGVAVDGRYVYFAGGYVGDLLPGQQQPITKSVWRWEPARNLWKRMVNLPEGRGGGALVKLGHDLHYFGGCLADRVTNSGTHWVLNLDDPTRWVQKRTLPKGRDHLAAVALDGKIYAIGGEFGHDQLSDQKNYVHRYDPRRNTWTRVASLPQAKSHMEAGTFVLGGTIICAGGQITGRVSTSQVDQYDPATNTWIAVKSLPQPRQGGTIQMVGHKILVALGATLTTEPQTDAWVGQLRTS